MYVRPQTLKPLHPRLCIVLRSSAEGSNSNYKYKVYCPRLYNTSHTKFRKTFSSLYTMIPCCIFMIIITKIRLGISKTSGLNPATDSTTKAFFYNSKFSTTQSAPHSGLWL